MTTLQTLIEGLGAQRQGAAFMARCPAHDDRNPSLSLTEKNGSVLFKFHAGCPQEAVMEASRIWVFGARQWPRRPSLR